MQGSECSGFTKAIVPEITNAELIEMAKHSKPPPEVAGLDEDWSEMFSAQQQEGTESK